MIIGPDVDMTNVTDEKAFADEYFAKRAEDKSAMTVGICAMKGRINERLQERSRYAYDDIVKAVESEAFQTVADYDYELGIFRTAAAIYGSERALESTIFDRIEYVEDFCTIYNKVLRYLRRIQVKFMRSVCMECMAYFRSERISVVAVTQILIEGNIGNKEDVAIELAGYYKEQGLINESLYIVSLMETVCPPEFKWRLQGKKNELLEMQR